MKTNFELVTTVVQKQPYEHVALVGVDPPVHVPVWNWVKQSDVDAAKEHLKGLIESGGGTLHGFSRFMHGGEPRHFDFCIKHGRTVMCQWIAIPIDGDPACLFVNYVLPGVDPEEERLLFEGGIVGDMIHEEWIPWMDVPSHRPMVTVGTNQANVDASGFTGDESTTARAFLLTSARAWLQMLADGEWKKIHDPDRKDIPNDDAPERSG